MGYDIKSTETFRKWLDNIKDATAKRKILARFDRIRVGNLGDHKAISANLFEFRMFFGPGFRVYFTIQGHEIVFLLASGDKSTQKRDITKAKKLLSQLED